MKILKEGLGDIVEVRSIIIPIGPIAFVLADGSSCQAHLIKKIARSPTHLRQESS